MIIDLIDLEGRQATLNEEPVSLTNKEFDLLAYLLVNPNRVFSREDMFERLWDMNAEGGYLHRDRPYPQAP